MKNFIQFGPFGGVVTSLDREMIPDNAAADLRNVTVEDGRITPRFGYRTLGSGAAPGDWVEGYGFDYVQGFNASNALVEEYVSFEKRGSAHSPYPANGISPWSVNVNTGARTLLTNGGAAVTLTAPAYGDQPGIKSFSFNDYAYAISPSDTPSLYQHTIGTANSFLPMEPPAAPSSAPAVQFEQGPSDGGSFATMRWDNGSALSSSAVTFSDSHLEANGTAASNGSGALTLLADGYGTNLTPLNETFTVNLTGTNGPGQQDLTYVDRIILLLYSPTIGWEPGQYSAVLTNASGETFQAQITDAQVNSSGGESSVMLVCDFPYKSSRSDWSTVQKITIGWQRVDNPNAGSSAFTNSITLQPVLLGQVNVAPTSDDGSGDEVNLQVGYTYYDTSTGLESEISPVLTLTPAQLAGPAVKDNFTGASYTLYSRPKLFLTANAALDSYRLYAKRPTDSNWFLVYDPGLATPTNPNGLIAQGATGAGGSNKTLGSKTYDATANLRLNWNELSLSSIFTLGGSPFKNLISACAYKGWVVWGFKGGYQNLQHSQIGNELVLTNNSDLTQLSAANAAAPANFTLADNGSDDPIAMFPVDQSLLILGEHGVYAQSGYSPTTMSPPYKLPTALGCCGQYACCLWHDDIGNPGVAFVSKNGEGVYMAQQDLYYLNETHYKVVELSAEVRGSLASFLLSGGGTLAQVRMWADHTRDSLWVACGRNVMVLRRPSLLDQQRHWEFYVYSFADSSSVAFVASDTRNRVRWMRGSGAIDENEWNSSLSAWISGTLPDGGEPIAPIYYQCRKSVQPNAVRVRFARVDRESLSDTPSLTVASTRETTTNTFASGKLNTRFGVLQQGKEHQVTVTLQDGSGYVRRVLLEVEGPLGDRWYE
jgi:hypothetical protein